MDKIRNFEEEQGFSKIIITPLPRPRPDLCKCVTSMIVFKSYLLFCLAALAGGSPIENLTLNFCLEKKKNLQDLGDV